MSLVIEFVGPPGSGKTTSCLYFMEQLRQQGLQVAGRRELREYIRDMNWFAKCMLFAKTALLKSPTVFLFTIVISKHKALNYDAVYRFARCCMFEVALKSFIKRNSFDFLLLDQWVVQDLWSATIFKNTSYQLLARRLKPFFGKPDALFYFDIELESATARLGNRNTSISRFDVMDATNRLQQLKKYCSYLFELYQASSCNYKKILPAAAAVEQNAALFLYHLDILLGKRKPVNVFNVMHYHQV